MIEAIINYFKAWEFYLLKSDWISKIVYPQASKRHEQAVHKVNFEVDRFIKTYLRDFEATPFLATMKKANMNEADIRQNVLEMILAGTDTSSVSLYYTVLLLSENERVADKLLASLSDPTSSYIDNVLKESMRMLPVGPVIIRQATSDCKLSDTIQIKKGKLLLINYYVQRYKCLLELDLKG